jgi:hypothetical protein
MGMNSMVGVCQQQKNNSGPAPTITITDVTFQTKQYGTISEGDPPPQPIPATDQITTVLNAGNSFTVPTDGLAQYYSNSNTSQQVFHVMTVNYTANFGESSLPSDSINLGLQANTINQALRTGNAANGNNFNASAIATSGGGDIGTARFTITGDGSVVTQISVTTVATGFNVGDTITFDGTSAGGTSAGTFFYTLTENDTSGNCQVAFVTTLNDSPAASQLNTWPLTGSYEGGFLPDSAKTNGLRITTSPSLQRIQMFPTAPIVGYTTIPLNGDIVEVLREGVVVETNATPRLNNITFAAQNLGASSSFDLVVGVRLGDGSTVSSPAQTITVPAGAVKTNLLAGVGINSYTTSTVAHGIQLGVDISPIEPSQALVSALNTANSFTTPPNQIGVGMAQGFADPAQQVLHSWLLNLDTSALNLSDYPATNLIVEYVFSWDADATNIGPAEAILWSAEDGLPVTVSGPTGEATYTQTVGVELDSINTDTLIPQASINLPAMGESNTDYGGAWKAYSPLIGEPVFAPYTVNLQVRIQKTDGNFTESPVLALNMTNEGVVPTMV